MSNTNAPLSVTRLATALFDVWKATRALEATWAAVKECERGVAVVAQWEDSPPRPLRSDDELGQARDQWKAAQERFDKALAAALSAVHGVDVSVRDAAGMRPAQWSTSLIRTLRSLNAAVVSTWGYKVCPDPDNLIQGFLAEVERQEHFLRARALDHSVDMAGIVAPEPNAKPSLSKKATAFALLKDHPDWTNEKIAKEAGCHVKTLSQWKAFKETRKWLKGYPPPPRGKKEDGRIDGEDER